MKQNKILSLIGLATKAGKTADGEFSTERAVKTRAARLVVVAADASGNTKKKFGNMCSFYKVPVYFYGSREELGKACGKEFRASLAVTDAGLSDAVMKEFINKRR